MVSAGEIAVVALVCSGVFFAFVAAVGLLRLPDLYTRAHSASKSDTLGAVLTLAGVAVVFGADVATAKTVFLLAFMFITNPTAAHAIARAAHDQGIEPWTAADREPEVGPAAGAERSTEPEPATDGGDRPETGADGGSDADAERRTAFGAEEGPVDRTGGDGS